MAKKIRGQLTSEDRQLWKKVAATVTPRSGVLPFDDEQDLDDFRTELEGFSASRPVKKKTKKPLGTREKAKTSPNIPSKHTLPPITPLERRVKSRLSRGVTAIDGRIDLHGMTQEQARAALSDFIFRAHASQWKVVLVITGKGRHVSRSERDCLDFGREAPGVLKRKTPEWLSDPKLRQCITSFDTASAAHGGEGALYVRLRSKRS